jgi:hypothetical protein
MASVPERDKPIYQESPTFAEAVVRLRGFLLSQKLSSQPLWVFREDVTSYKRRVLVKEPVPPENQKLVELYYELGRQRGYGVRIEVLCLLHKRPCCYIWLPQDRMDAEYALMLFSSLIISVPTELPEARPVTSELKWRAYRWHDEKSGLPLLVDRVPRRNI